MACGITTLTYRVISLFDMKAYCMHFLNMYGLWGSGIKNEHDKHLCKHSHRIRRVKEAKVKDNLSFNCTLDSSSSSFSSFTL